MVGADSPILSTQYGAHREISERNALNQRRQGYLICGIQNPRPHCSRYCFLHNQNCKKSVTIINVTALNLSEK